MVAAPWLALVLLLGQVDGGVPSSLLSAAVTDPMNFASLLTASGVPAGVEIRESDRLRIRQRRPPPAEAQPRLVPIEELTAVFNKGQSEYVAVVQDGVVVIRPRSGRAAYLGTRPFSGVIAGTGLMRVSEKVFAPLDRRLDQPGGRPASRLGQPGVEVDYGDGLHISVNQADKLTVLDVLIQVAKQAPGHAWVVATAGEPTSRIMRLGFIHGASTTTNWMTIQSAPEN